DARDERNTNGLWQHHRILEHSVDAIADGDSCLACLEVDVAGSGGDPFGDDVIYQLDDRALGFLLVELLFRVFGLLYDRWNRVPSWSLNEFVDTFDRGVHLLYPVE